MLQKSVPFKSIYMKIDAVEIEKIQVPSLPVGYSYRFYQEGDQENWAKLETLVDEFATIEAARERFESEFLPSGDRYQALAQKFSIAENILDQRQVFIEAPNGEVVATATAWLANKFGEYQNGESAKSHGLTGKEIYSFKGISAGLTPSQLIDVTAKDPDTGKEIHFKAKSRLNSEIEIAYYVNGGILQYVMRKHFENES